MPNKTINDDTVKWPSLKKYPCKKLKGDHDFELDQVWSPSSHYLVGFVEKLFGCALYHYKCSACGKKHISSTPLMVKKKTKNYIER